MDHFQEQREPIRPTVGGLMLMVAKWAIAFGAIAAGVKTPGVGIPLVVLLVLCVFLRIIYRDFKNPFG